MPQQRWTESTILLEKPETLDAELLQEEEAEAEGTKPGLTMLTDGPRLEDGATRYSVDYKNGQSWAGTKTHMDYSQEVYDAECVALARALETASRRQTLLERITIFTDAQAAIRRMASKEPGRPEVRASGMKAYRKRRTRPDITIEIRWCPVHKGVAAAGNEKGDEPNSLRKSQMPVGWNGEGILTERRRARCCSLGLLHTSRGRYRRRSGLKRGSGQEAGPPERGAGCRAERSPKSRLRVVPRGLPRGSTN